MGNTSIEWTDKSWNPIAAYFKGKRGWMCSKPSPGCKNCYSERLNLRLGNGLRYTPENVAKVEWRLVNLTEPGRWRQPQRVFVESMGDLFHEALPDEIIWEVWYAMLYYHRHTFQVLTKRADRMRTLVESFKARDSRNADHIWLGVSVERQEEADKRIPELLKTPTAVRFLSCEPLLGPIDLSQIPIHWCIVGGESGPNARPSHPDWFRSLRDQCQAAGVAFFFKQWGEWTPAGPIEPDPEFAGGAAFDDPRGGRAAISMIERQPARYRRLSNDTVLVRVGKEKAGRLLDGAEYSQFPEVHQ